MGNDGDSDNLCNTSSMFGFSDCMLIVDLETHRTPATDVMENDSSRVMKLQVNSTVLSGQSPFFRDLLTNATMESGQRCVFLSIRDSDEAAFMELLNCMHSGALTSTTEPALLEVLKLADEFQVASCARLCASSLMEMPMTSDSALTYLSLLTVDDQVQHLVDNAKQFVATQPIDTCEHWSDIMKLSLAGIEAVLSSDFLEAGSEYDLFELALDWTEAHYPDLEDRRRIFSTRLARYIRFPYMAPHTLRDKVLSCDLLDGDFARKVVADALFFRITTPLHHHHHRDANAIEDSTPTSHRPYVRRPYSDPLVKVVEFESPRREVMVYFDLSASVSFVCMEEFKWGGYQFRLFVSAASYEDRVGVYLESGDKDLKEPLALEYEFAARSERTGEFVLKSSGSLEFRHRANVYETSLLDFRAGKSLDFIDGVVYVEFKLRRNRAVK